MPPTQEDITDDSNRHEVIYSPLESLPSELFAAIIENTDLPSIGSIIVTSRRCKHLFEGSRKQILDVVVQKTLGSRKSLRYAYAIATLERQPEWNMNNAEQLQKFLMAYCGIDKDGFDNNNLLPMDLDGEMIRLLVENHKLVNSYVQDYAEVYLSGPKPSQTLSEWVKQREFEEESRHHSSKYLRLHSPTDEEEIRIARAFYFLWYFNLLFPVKSSFAPKFCTAYLRMGFDKQFVDHCVNNIQIAYEDDFCLENYIKDERHAFDFQVDMHPDKWIVKDLSYWEAVEVKAVYEHLLQKMSYIHQSEGFRGQLAEDCQKISLATGRHIFPEYREFLYFITAGLKTLYPTLLGLKAVVTGDKQRAFAMSDALVFYIRHANTTTNMLEIALKTRLTKEFATERRTVLGSKFVSDVGMMMPMARNLICYGIWDDWRLKNFGLKFKNETTLGDPETKAAMASSNLLSDDGDNNDDDDDIKGTTIGVFTMAINVPDNNESNDYDYDYSQDPDALAMQAEEEEKEELDDHIGVVTQDETPTG